MFANIKMKITLWPQLILTLLLYFQISSFIIKIENFDPHKNLVREPLFYFPVMIKQTSSSRFSRLFVYNKNGILMQNVCFYFVNWKWFVYLYQSLNKNHDYVRTGINLQARLKDIWVHASKLKSPSDLFRTNYSLLHIWEHAISLYLLRNKKEIFKQFWIYTGLSLWVWVVPHS